MKPQMKLIPDDPHTSWAPERTEKTGVAASVRGLSTSIPKF